MQGTTCATRNAVPLEVDAELDDGTRWAVAAADGILPLLWERMLPATFSPVLHLRPACVARRYAHRPGPQRKSVQQRRHCP